MAVRLKVIPTEAALLITALLIGGSMMVSMIKTRRLTKEIAATEAVHGWVPGSPPKPKSGVDSPPEQTIPSEKS